MKKGVLLIGLLSIVLFALIINFINAGDPSNFAQYCNKTGCFIYNNKTSCGNSSLEIFYILSNHNCPTVKTCFGNSINITVFSEKLKKGLNSKCYKAVKASCNYIINCQSGFHCDPTTVTCVQNCVCSSGDTMCDSNGDYLVCSNGCDYNNTGKVAGQCGYNPNVCINPNQTIMKLYDSTNAIAGVWNSELAYEICFNEIFNYDSITDIHTCNENNSALLWLNNNGFGSVDETAEYNIPVCYGRLLCRQVNTSESGQDCNSDEKTIINLNNSIGASFSAVNNDHYPIKICCKEKLIPIEGNANWQNLNEQNILSSDINDMVRLVLNRSDVSNKNITYNIYKKCSGVLQCIWTFFTGESKIGQFSSKGFLTLKLNESGEFYFNATVEEYADNYSSNILNVRPIASNAMPRITIIKPIENSTFIVKDNGLTNNIPFEQISSDEDDLIDVYWNFNEGSIFKFENCNNGTSNCNISHQYNSSFAGTRIVSAMAKELTRSQLEYDLNRIYVYKEGLVLFIIIDSPNYKLREFPPTPIKVDSSSTYIANCSISKESCEESGEFCEEINDSFNPLDKIYCYRYAESSDSRFIFNWTVDGVTKPEYPTDSSPFNIIFPTGGKHDIKLKIKFNLA